MEVLVSLVLGSLVLGACMTLLYSAAQTHATVRADALLLDTRLLVEHRIQTLAHRSIAFEHDGEDLRFLHADGAYTVSVADGAIVIIGSDEPPNVLTGPRIRVTGVSVTSASGSQPVSAHTIRFGLAAFGFTQERFTEATISVYE